MPTFNPLVDCIALPDIAPLVGSYASAYSLAVAGAFGPSIAKVGRSQLFRRSLVEPAVAKYLAKRAQRTRKAAV